MGSVLTQDGEAAEDILLKIQNVQVAFNRLNKIWKDRKICIKTKIKLFNSNMKSILLYEAEIW